MEDLLKALIYIQQHLTVPKDLYNDFGKFNYRSLESILAALKPLLRNQNCGIRFEDEVIELSGRTFLKTTLYFFNDKGETITTCAIAEHTATKSGMDAAQITGAASSYARKYACNALFAIDDSKDPDTDVYQETNQQHQQPRKTATAKKANNSPRAATAEPPAKGGHYQAIEKALSECSNIDQLIDIYNQHKNEVDANPEILALFRERKQEIRKVIEFA